MNTQHLSLSENRLIFLRESPSSRPEEQPMNEKSDNAPDAAKNIPLMSIVSVSGIASHVKDAMITKELADSIASATKKGFAFEVSGSRPTRLHVLNAKKDPVGDVWLSTRSERGIVNNEHWQSNLQQLLERTEVTEKLGKGARALMTNTAAMNGLAAGSALEKLIAKLTPQGVTLRTSGIGKKVINVEQNGHLVGQIWISRDLERGTVKNEKWEAQLKALLEEKFKDE